MKSTRSCWSLSTTPFSSSSPTMTKSNNRSIMAVKLHHQHHLHQRKSFSAASLQFYAQKFVSKKHDIRYMMTVLFLLFGQHLQLASWHGETMRIIDKPVVVVQESSVAAVVAREIPTVRISSNNNNYNYNSNAAFENDSSLPQEHDKIALLRNWKSGSSSASRYGPGIAKNPPLEVAGEVIWGLVEREISRQQQLQLEGLQLLESTTTTTTRTIRQVNHLIPGHISVTVQVVTATAGAAAATELRTTSRKNFLFLESNETPVVEEYDEIFDFYYSDDDTTVDDETAVERNTKSTEPHGGTPVLSSTKINTKDTKNNSSSRRGNSIHKENTSPTTTTNYSALSLLQANPRYSQALTALDFLNHDADGTPNALTVPLHLLWGEEESSTKKAHDDFKKTTTPVTAAVLEPRLLQQHHSHQQQSYNSHRNNNDNYYYHHYKKMHQNRLYLFDSGTFVLPGKVGEPAMPVPDSFMDDIRLHNQMQEQLQQQQQQQKQQQQDDWLKLLSSGQPMNDDSTTKTRASMQVDALKNHKESVATTRTIQSADVIRAKVVPPNVVHSKKESFGDDKEEEALGEDSAPSPPRSAPTWNKTSCNNSNSNNNKTDHPWLKQPLLPVVLPVLIESMVTTSPVCRMDDHNNIDEEGREHENSNNTMTAPEGLSSASSSSSSSSSLFSSSTLTVIRKGSTVREALRQGGRRCKNKRWNWKYQHHHRSSSSFSSSPVVGTSRFSA